MDDDTDNTVSRDRFRAGAVECPLCGRQVANPADHLLAFGAVDRLSVETADAFECPACGGVNFVTDREQ